MIHYEGNSSYKAQKYVFLFYLTIFCYSFLRSQVQIASSKPTIDTFIFDIRLAPNRNQIHRIITENFFS